MIGVGAEGRVRAPRLVWLRWCPGEDSNLHELLHWYLKPARLPVPPPGQVGRIARGAGIYAPIQCLSTEAPLTINRSATGASALRCFSSRLESLRFGPG